MAAEFLAGAEKLSGVCSTFDYPAFRTFAFSGDLVHLALPCLTMGFCFVCGNERD
jgi:hypothetical protein